VKIQDAPFGESFGRPDVMWLIVAFHVTFTNSPTKHDDLVTYNDVPHISCYSLNGSTVESKTRTKT
jgi:hypothetical protein